MIGSSLIIFADISSANVTFSNVYGVTTSNAYDMDVQLVESVEDSFSIQVQSSAATSAYTVIVPPSATNVQASIALDQGNANTLTFDSPQPIASLNITAPIGTFYSATGFSVMGSASHYNCTTGLCAPVGAKITNLSPNGTANLGIEDPSINPVAGSKYVEITYINNDVAISTSWTDGRNARNITVQINNAAPVRLEVPLSGRSSELYSPMRGWGDPATLGILVDGFGTGKSVNGTDEIVVGNVGGENGVQSYGADFVGLRVLW